MRKSAHALSHSTSLLCSSIYKQILEQLTSNQPLIDSQTMAVELTSIDVRRAQMMVDIVGNQTNSAKKDL
jgi:hypothetical protein